MPTPPRFDSEVARDASAATYAPMSDARHRPPRVHFDVGGFGAMSASPPGVRIVCELVEYGRARVRLSDARPEHRGEHIADVIVVADAGHTITEETIAIASAIYWSWWRARDMCGEAP